MAIITMDFYSKALWRNTSIKVILPFDKVANPEGVKEPYKTLYFLNGYSADAEEIISCIRLTEQSLYKGFAVVLMNGENSFYVDQPVINTNYSQFVAEEVVSVTRRLFPLSDKREDTFIGGISMGGYGALMLAGRYPHVFSKTIGLSPSTDAYGLVELGHFTKEFMDRIFSNKENYLEQYHPLHLYQKIKAEGKDLPQIYFCCGTEDPLTYTQCKELEANLKAENIPATFEENEGTHDIPYWNKMLPDAIDFMFKK